MNEKKSVNLTFRRSDFSQQAIDLGIWDELIEGLNPGTDSVEVQGVRWAS